MEAGIEGAEGGEEVGGEDVVLDAVAVPREMLGGSSYGSFSSALPAVAAGILNTSNTSYMCPYASSSATYVAAGI